MMTRACLAVFLLLPLSACTGSGTDDCVEICDGKCGAYEGCDCEGCGDGFACEDNVCMEACIPVCDGFECGDDGCGGSCGSCPLAAPACNAGSCCTPDCADAECGDDGCGGVCGVCSEDLPECVEGLCSAVCVPDCEDKECGDDGCGNSCGDCPTAAPVCNEGLCEPDCVGNCEGLECGDDGCGKSCGGCPDNHVCLAEGVCLCQPDCAGKCGEDGCGGECGECPGLQEDCVDGLCVCQPACDSKNCGPDGCGESCGECPENHDCLADGTCLCVPDCSGSDCGSDGCGGSCGSCGCGEYCIDGLCVFTACDGKECGPDTCGGNCGVCPPGAACVQGLCPPEGTGCEDFNETPWDGCTDGQVTEFQANEYTQGDQKAPDIAMLADGRFLVVWQSALQDGNSEGVFARFFFPGLEPDAGDFQVNSESYGTQKDPRAAAVGEARFVVVWGSSGQDGFMDGVFGQLFDLDGFPDGDEFQVNTYTTASQIAPAVAGFPGGFVVVWESPGQDGSDTGIMGQRFAPDGEKWGTEFQVNTYFLVAQKAPAIDTFDDGRFVVAWSSWSQDGSDWGVFGQRFMANGDMEGQEFQVNTHTGEHQYAASVAVTGDSTFAMSWQSLDQDGSDYGIYGQRFNLSVGKSGSEFKLNEHIDQVQEAPSLAAAPTGDFAAAWQSCATPGAVDPPQDGDGCGIVARRYQANGSAVGQEFVVNVSPTGEQTGAATAMSAAGDFAVTWASCPPPTQPNSAQDGSGCGIFVQRINPDGERLYR